MGRGVDASLHFLPSYFPSLLSSSLSNPLNQKYVPISVAHTPHSLLVKSGYFLLFISSVSGERAVFLFEGRPLSFQSFFLSRLEIGQKGKKTDGSLEHRMFKLKEPLTHPVLSRGCQMDCPLAGHEIAQELTPENLFINVIR